MQQPTAPMERRLGGSARLDQLFFTSMRTLDVNLDDDEETTDPTDKTTLLRKRLNGSLEDALALSPQDPAEKSAEDPSSSSALSDDIYGLAASGQLEVIGAPLLGAKPSSQKMSGTRPNLGRKSLSTDSFSAIAAKGGRKLRSLGKKSLSSANLFLNKPSGHHEKPNLPRMSNANASFGHLNASFRDLGLNRLLKGKKEKSESPPEATVAEGNRDEPGAEPEPFDIAIIQKPEKGILNDVESESSGQPNQDQPSGSSHVPSFSIHPSGRRRVRDTLTQSAHTPRIINDPLRRPLSVSAHNPRRRTSPRRHLSNRTKRDTTRRHRERTNKTETERTSTKTASERESNGTSRPRSRTRRARSTRNLDVQSSSHGKEEYTLRKEKENGNGSSCPDITLSPDVTKRAGRESRRRHSFRTNLRAELSIDDNNTSSRRLKSLSKRSDTNRLINAASGHSRRTVARRRAYQSNAPSSRRPIDSTDEGIDSQSNAPSSRRSLDSADEGIDSQSNAPSSRRSLESTNEGVDLEEDIDSDKSESVSNGSIQ